MCGIFGFWLNRKLNKDDIEKGKKTTRLLNHRGPDGSGFVNIKEQGLFISHTRLSIIDLSEKGSQPMKKHNMIISFNGEIYNYIEIKDYLISKGYQFFSKSDTEVLLSAFDYWGIDAVKKIDGMFAIALFRNNNLYLISDYFLEKPLYYVNNDLGVYFSSEPECLEHHLNLKKAKQDIDAFIALGFLENGETGFESLKSLPQSSIIKFKDQKSKKITKYWSLPPFTKYKKNDLNSKFIDEYIDLILISLKRRLRSDAKIGLFLSSGLDSSLIAILLKFELKEDIDTFTFSFSNSYDESHKVSQFVKYLNLKNEKFKFQKKHSSDEKLLLDIFSYPNDNSTSISIRNMCKKIKKKYKVILSGIGGDELTLGYNKYQFIKKYSFLYNNIKLTTLLINIIKFSGIRGKKVDLLKYYFDGSESWKLISLKNGNSLKKEEKLSGMLKLNIEKENSTNFLDKILSYDFHQTLPYSYLAAIDRGSMRESVEIRSPFLQKCLFEKIREINPNILISNQKILFRKILERYLPKKLIQNEKKGFVKPVNTSVTRFANINNELMHLQKIYSKSNDYNSKKILSRINLMQSFLS